MPTPHKPAPLLQFDIAARDDIEGGWTFVRSMRGPSAQSVRARFLAAEPDYAPEDIRAFRHKPPTPAQKQELARSRAARDRAYAGLPGTRAERTTAAASQVAASNAIRQALAAQGWRFTQGRTEGDVLAFDFTEQMHFRNDRQGGTLSLVFHPNDTGD